MHQIHPISLKERYKIQIFGSQDMECTQYPLIQISIIFMLMVTDKLPVENVILCLSLFALGLKMFMPLLRFAFAKCLINVASTLSISFVTCRKTFTISLKDKGSWLYMLKRRVVLNPQNCYIKCEAHLIRAAKV